MSIYSGIFPLGIGTKRFAVAGAGDRDGIAEAAQLVVSALEAGVSYIDVAQPYSKGAAMDICREAFAKTNAPRHITVKSSFLSDKTADDAIRRIDIAFTNMGIDHAFCFVIWNISSYVQFEAIMKKGGLYDGAQRAKESGLVEHICFSTHAPPQDIIKILNAGVFEGVTVSFSALNGEIMRPVLDCAEGNKVGVVVMNPLGGGLIPQQEKYFSFLRGEKETSTAQAALRYVYAHPAVKVVLSGMRSKQEMLENLKSFQESDTEEPRERIARVNRAFENIEGFCTGCRYCDGCPQNIPVYELMQDYNTILFSRSKISGKQIDQMHDDLSETRNICARLKNTFGFMPENTANLCLKCGRCETYCTARLPIIQRLEELYHRFSKAGFSKHSMLARLRDLIGSKRKIAFYPGGGYTAYVLELLKEAFPGVSFDLSCFDSSQNLWGTTVAGVKIQRPDNLVAVNPELVIVSNYNYLEEIYMDLSRRLKGQIPVVKLHKPQDVPWVF